MNFKEPKLNLYDLFVTVIYYFIAMALVMYAIKLVKAVFNDNVAVVSYLLLPHGIRIIAVMAYGPVNSLSGFSLPIWLRWSPCKRLMQIPQQ